MLSEQTTDEARGEAADPYCLRAGEAARLLAGHPWRRFVVIGDSVAEGIGDPVPGYPDLPWAGRVAEELRAVCPELEFLNLGRRNTRASQVRAGQLAKALAFEPDLALVACGGYDTLRPSFEVGRTQQEIRGIVAPLREAGAEVVTVSMLDGSGSPAVPERFRDELGRRLAALSDATKEISAELGTLHVDLSEHPAGSSPDIISADGRHGNRRGQAIAAAEAVRRLGARVAAVTRGNGVGG